jgi:hypothetical protein
MTKTNPPVVKQFDCIKVKQAVQSQVMAETTDMSTGELLSYFNRGASAPREPFDYTEWQRGLFEGSPWTSVTPM